MSTIYGNPLLLGEGGEGNNGLNVFCSTTQPTAQNGLWIKKAKGVTGQTSIIYPDYPLSVDANTSGIILVFEELPTGSFLTWPNNNAILIPTIKQS